MTNNANPPDDPMVVRASEIVDERTDWLWHGRVPFGSLSRIDGDPGLGKSLLTVDLAARASRGLPMPCSAGRGNPIRVAMDNTTLGGSIDVLMLAAEDNAGTVRRRLTAAKADLDRVHLVVADSVTFPKSAQWLEGEIQRTGARLVVIDPLMSFLDPVLNANQDQDVRRALRPLRGMAERTGAAVLFVGHLNKSGGTTAVYRSVGSIGLLASVRVAMIVAKDRADEDRRVVAVSKSNLGLRPAGQVFVITESDEGEPVVDWLGTTGCSADSLVAPRDVLAPDKGAQAKAMLLELLEDRDVPAGEVQAEARRRGIGWRTVGQAKADLGIEHYARPTKGVKGPGEYVWTSGEGLRSVTPGTPQVADLKRIVRQRLNGRNVP